MALLEFQGNWLGNGELEIYDPQGGTLLGRKEPHIPVNIELVETLENFRALANNARRLAEERKAQEQQHRTPSQGEGAPE